MLISRYLQGVSSRAVVPESAPHQGDSHGETEHQRAEECEAEEDQQESAQSYCLEGPEERSQGFEKEQVEVGSHIWGQVAPAGSLGSAGVDLSGVWS